MKLTVKLGLATLFILVVLIGIGLGVFYAGLQFTKLIVQSKLDVIESFKLRADQETRIRLATEKAVKENLEQFRESYLLSAYIRMNNKGVPNPVIQEEVELTFHYAKVYNLDPYRIFALIKQECTFDPLLPPGKAGELGAMQVTPGVFKDFMLVFGYTWNDFHDWTKVHRVGIAKLAELHKKYSGNWDKIYIEYNAGLQKDRETLAKYYVKVINQNYKELIKIKALSHISYKERYFL